MTADRPASHVSPFQLHGCHPPATFAVVLGLIAGCVDACTFLGLFGLYVAQVTGSFVFSGTKLVIGGSAEMVQFLAIPVFFAGGIAATATAMATQALRGPALPVTLTLELALLAGFVTLTLHGAPYAKAEGALVPALLAMAAMGVQSATVRLLMTGTPSTNVMTTNTSQLAIDVTETVVGLFRRRPDEADQRAAIRRRLASSVRVTASFFAGAVGGGLLFVEVGLMALLLPLAALAAATLWSFLRLSRWQAARA